MSPHTIVKQIMITAIGFAIALPFIIYCVLVAVERQTITPEEILCARTDQVVKSVITHPSRNSISIICK